MSVPSFGATLNEVTRLPALVDVKESTVSFVKCRQTIAGTLTKLQIPARTFVERQVCRSPYPWVLHKNVGIIIGVNNNNNNNNNNDNKDFVISQTTPSTGMMFTFVRRSKEQPAFSFCLEADFAGGVKVESSGKGYLQLWKRQIHQLNRVGPEAASAIVEAYPSPQLLCKAYKSCASEHERADLLTSLMIRRGEGVTATSRRVGSELSRRLHLLLTARDPDLVLDSFS
uniref:ERCC4 domain-containing protein n=1 Tax=Eptatretus burgeri TaxID=7764 RepID=A0A8C4N6R9_EPTBU